MASEINATSTEPTAIMDSSTHSTSSSQPPNNPVANNAAASAAAPTNASAANGPTPSSSPKRGPPPQQQQQQQQLLKLREANTKYKNLLKLAKERIQEQEGLLDERRCESTLFIIFCVKKLSIVERDVFYIHISWSGPL